MAHILTTTAFMATCLVDQIYPEVGIAAVKVLRRVGVQVEYPHGQTCCGQPFYNSGFVEQAAALAKKTIEIFESYQTVVLPSGSCTAMIRVGYSELFKGDPEWRERAKALAGKTFELSEFIAKFAKDKMRNNSSPSEASYHDSCHMCRALGLKEEPRAALAQAGYKIHEMKESDRCCGFGGLFSLKMPQVSAAITKEKLKEGIESGAKVLVTADPGCLMQMRAVLEDEEIRVIHFAEALEVQTR